VAAYLNGVASVCLELDEGNKYARGHPAAHVLPAALAMAQRVNASGRELIAAYLAGYEVAARFGRATQLRPDVHPHGNWGVTGAAAACARLLGLDAERTAQAIDASCGMMVATPWSMALEGDLVRNSWMGACAMSGISAARMGQAGLTVLSGTASWSLGEVLGTFDAAELTAELGSRHDLSSAYYKRHSSCSYTHPPADAALDLAGQGLRSEEVASVKVETHPIAARLNGSDAGTRLAAMFSVPYVVSAMLARGKLTPDRFDDTSRHDPEIGRLLRSTTVESTPEFEARLPHQRGARVIVTLRDGSIRSAEVPNPVGDSAYHPFTLDDIRIKLSDLLPSSFPVARLETLARELGSAEKVNSVLEALP
jgi:2-methylcitrate dehydratase PrpD